MRIIIVLSIFVLMNHNILNTELTYLKGVGPKRAAILASELGIRTYEQMLSYFPFRYIDRTQFHEISNIDSNEISVQLKGKITKVDVLGRGRAMRLSALLQDDTGIIELVWFRGINFFKDKLVLSKEYLVYGKPTKFGNKFSINHPEIEKASEDVEFSSKLQPVYSSSEKLSKTGLTGKGIGYIFNSLLPVIGESINENLSSFLISKYNFVSHKESILKIHHPSSYQDVSEAQFRLKYEEFFFIQLSLIEQNIVRKDQIAGIYFGNIGKFFNGFYSNNLPFELTGAQKRVIKEIRKDFVSGKQMNRLLQGDVGSGKTLVALMTMLIAADSGYQAALMAPTEILAQQHFTSISKFLEGLDINIKLLTGSTKVSVRRKLHEDLESGEINILIGTHALIEDKVKFHNLGYVVIDEQHRFGVQQRAKLWTKGKYIPHILVMTATPIPRTMAMTLYGDLDYSVIDELPPGRKPIQTYHYSDAKRIALFGFMKKQIAQGRQVYIVYPLIEESETLDLKDLHDGYNSVSRDFPKPDYQISVVHGKMKAKAKEEEMARFKKGETQIMVATTVIEVGVDVPNATVMVIENAERFGLSQLHQLRGRVGRGGGQSYCILMSSYKLSNEAKIRLETMVRTSDGFEIAEADLKLRGPGDMEGTQQSGVLDLRIADIIKDESILKDARADALNVLEKDPKLELIENVNIAKYFKKIKAAKTNWARIS